MLLVPVILSAFILVLAVEPNEARPGNWRVIDGSPASVGQFPYAVNVVETCTGSIVAPNMVLTAGHCVCRYVTLPHWIYIVAGINVRPNYRDRDHQKVTVSQIYVHPNYPNYCGNMHPNDIALVKLEKNLQFNSNVQQIQVDCNYRKPPKADQYATLIGFGKDNTGTSGWLRYGYTLLSDTCPKVDNVKEGYICNKSGSKSGPGDSGGPLVLNGRQIGVVSGAMNNVSGYTGTHLNCDWLRQYISVVNS